MIIETEKAANGFMVRLNQEQRPYVFTSVEAMRDWITHQVEISCSEYATVTPPSTSSSTESDIPF